MEIMIQWFWIVKLMVLGTFVLSLWKCYKSKFRSKFWWVMVFVGFVLLFIQPIKMIQDQNVIKNVNYRIKTNKEVIPEKVLNKYFENTNEKVKGILEKDLK